MDTLRTAFKNCVSIACDILRVNFSEFAATRGLSDFELDTFDEGREPHEIAALALHQLCRNDGGRHDGVVCLAVIEFLDGIHGRRKEDPSRTTRARDLKLMVSSRSTESAYRQWATTWYSDQRNR